MTFILFRNIEELLVGDSLKISHDPVMVAHTYTTVPLDWKTETGSLELSNLRPTWQHSKTRKKGKKEGKWTQRGKTGKHELSF